MLMFDNKPVNFVATEEWNYFYGGLESMIYRAMVAKALTIHPVDMYVFEQPSKGKLQVRSAGYDLLKRGVLDETTVILTIKSLEVEKFWCKIDNWGDKYVATFLFPHEY